MQGSRVRIPRGPATVMRFYALSRVAAPVLHKSTIDGIVPHRAAAFAAVRFSAAQNILSCMKGCFLFCLSNIFLPEEDPNEKIDRPIYRLRHAADAPRLRRER